MWVRRSAGSCVPAAGQAVLLAAVAAILAAGCRSERPRDDSALSRIVIGIGRDFFDGPDSRAYVHGSTQTWEGLTDLDDDLAARPRLAVTWESEDDAREWRFHLRPGVLFHDGTPVRASDVVASIERIRQHPKYDPAAVYRDVVSVRAPDPGEIVFRLRRPSPSFPNLVAYYSSPILKPATFKTDGALSHLVATGPYRLSHVVAGETVVTERFDGYWGAEAAYDQVVFRAIPDARTRVGALLAGEIDAIADVGALLPAQIDGLRRAPHVHVGQREVATTHYLFFNCGRAAFCTPNARRWLAALVGRRTLVAKVVGGAGIVALDPFTRLARGWTTGALVDPPKASTPPPPTMPVDIVLSTATVERWPYLEIAQYLEDLLRRAGWNARIAVLEPGLYQRTLRARDFDLLLQPNTLMTGDPDFFYSSYLRSQAPSCFGCGGAAMDALIDSARHETDLDRRRAAYQRLARIVGRDRPLLPLYFDVSAFAYRRAVGTFAIDAHFRPRLTRTEPGAAP